MDNPFSTANLAPTWARATEILKGDVPGHEFHGNQYTQGLASTMAYARRIGETDARNLKMGVKDAKAYTVDTSGRSSGLTASDPAPLGKDLPTPLVSEVSFGKYSYAAFPGETYGNERVEYHISDKEGGEIPGEHPEPQSFRENTYSDIRLATDGAVDFQTEVMYSFKDGDGWNEPEYASDFKEYEYTTDLTDKEAINGMGDEVASFDGSPLAGCTDFSLSREVGGSAPSEIKPDTMIWGTTPSGDRAPMTTVAQMLHASKEHAANQAQDEFDRNIEDY